MKKPKAPTKPKQPYKPIEPQKKLPAGSKFIRSLEIRTYSPYTINSLTAEIKPIAEELGINVGDCELRFEIEPGRYGDSDYLSLHIYYAGETNNLNYDTQYKDYLKRLAKYETDMEKFEIKNNQYKVDLKGYNKKLKEWQLENAKKTIKKLEKELEQ